MVMKSSRFAAALALSCFAIFAALTQAQEALPDSPDKAKVAASPDQCVLLLKTAWESHDDAAVAARYADPGRSIVRRELATARRREAAEAALAKAIKEKIAEG